MSPLRREMEKRRLAAAADLRAGMSVLRVARKYLVSRISVYRWLWAMEKGQQLAARRACGRKRKLDRLLIADLLVAENLTAREIAAAIEARCGVRYDPDHISRVRKQMREGMGLAGIGILARRRKDGSK